MKNIILLVALTLALAGGAFAQFEPIDTSIHSSFSFVGDQTSEGEYNFTLGQHMGTSFVVNGNKNSKYSSTLLTMSMDYSGPEDTLNGNTIVGGSWNMAIYSKDVYLGSIYGAVSGGDVSWTITESGRYSKRQTESVSGTKTTSAYMTVTGGTGAFANYESSNSLFISGTTDLETRVTEVKMKDINL